MCLVPTVARIRWGGGFALVNLQVALVFGYGKDSCQLRFLYECWSPGSAAGQGVGPPSLCGVSSFLYLNGHQNYHVFPLMPSIRRGREAIRSAVCHTAFS